MGAAADAGADGDPCFLGDQRPTGKRRSGGRAIDTGPIDLNRWLQSVR
jgi:hypothetical protein